MDEEWVEGKGGEDCQSPEHQASEREGPNSPPTHPPIPQGPYYTPLEWGRREGRDAHMHIYIYTMHSVYAHLYTNTHSPTQIQQGSNGPNTLTLICFSYPFFNPPIFSSPTPYLLLDSLLTHHRAILQVSVEVWGGERMVGWGGGIFGEIERSERRKGGRKGGGGTIT